MKKIIFTAACVAGLMFSSLISLADNSDIISSLCKKDSTDDPFATLTKKVKDDTAKLDKNKKDKKKTETVQQSIDDAIKSREDKYNSIKTDIEAKIAKLNDSVTKLTEQLEKAKGAGGDTSSLEKNLKIAQDDLAKYQEALKKLEGYFTAATAADPKKDAKKADAKKK